MKFKKAVIKKIILLSLFLLFCCAGFFGIIEYGNAQFCVKCSDINNDNIVDITDGSTVGISWGTCLGDPGYNSNADLNDDGCVNDDDITCVSDDWDKTRAEMPECACTCINDGCCKLGCAIPGDPDCSCAENTGTCCGAGNNCTGSTMNSNSSDCPQSECCQNAGDCPSIPPPACQCNYTPWVNGGECGEGCGENEIPQVRTESPVDCGAGDCGELSRCYGMAECILNLPDKSISDIIEDIIDWLLTITVAVAIIMLIAGGIMYIMAAGDEARILLAKKIVTYAILGLLVVGLSYVIVKETANIIEGLK